MTTNKPVAVAAQPFDGLGAEVMAELRTSLDALLSNLGTPITRAVDLERALRLDRTLAWQVFRLSQSADLSDAANVPSRTSLRRLLTAAGRRRAPKPVLDRVSAAFERFENFATTHGGDRNGLISVISGGAPEANEQYELRTRRAAFRALAHLWGLRTELQVRTLIQSEALGESAGERRTLIAAEVGLQQLHRGRPLMMTSWLRYDPSEQGCSIGPYAQRPGGRRPATPGPQDLNLLDEFCTQPMPEMAPQQTADGGVEVEMVFPTAGRAGAQTLYMLHDSLCAEPMLKPVSVTKMFMCVPTEAVVCDVLVPAGWSDPTSPRAMVFGRRHHPERAGEERTVDLLPQRVNFLYLGPSDAVPPIDGAPRHAEAVRRILNDMGMAGRRFDVYRCRVEYPLLHSLLVLKMDRLHPESGATLAPARPG